MKKYRKYRLLIYILMVIFIYFITIQNSIIAEENLVFGDMNIYPLEPTPLSAVNFTIGVNTNITVEDVRLIVQEYAGEKCFIDEFNVSMNYSYTCCMDFYETQIKFIHENTTQIKYYVKILNNNTWYTSNTSVTNLSIPRNNTPETIPKNKSTPGFEIPLFILSITFTLAFRWGKTHFL